MPKQIIIAEQYRTAAVFSEDQIEEIIVATGTHQVGDVYMGVVENILTSIDAAFVNIGDNERNGFIHLTDLGPLRLRRSGGSSISDLLAPQQRVLVQVMKEPTGNKGPRLTGNISMPGRYVVLMPFGRGVNLSRRIRNENERNRLRALAILIKPSGMGLLVRTEAEGMPEDSIIEDLETLQKQWEAIQYESSTTRMPSLLDRENDFIQRVLRDVYTNEVNRIVTDTSEGTKRVKHHLANWGDGKVSPSVFIDHHRERTSILEYFRVNAAIREALRPRVDLPSGGYIIIEPTEALTVIDVNSGSFTRSRTSQETVLWTNREAAAEVARQVRLRNIAGVIVVDFIDMDSRRDQLQLLEHFEKALRADKSRPQIAQLTELGLVEMTRKRQGQSIYELFGRPCPTCNGLGYLAQLPGETTPQAAEPTPRQWEARFTPKIDLEDEDQEFSLSGGLEANLPSHPNYQERTDRSRRKRRSKDNEKPANNNLEVRLRSVEPRLESKTESLRIDTRVEPRIEPRIETTRTEQREFPVRSLPTPAKLKEIVDLPPEVVVEAPAERVVPERAGRREVPRPKLEAPEIITVEMTPEEQEVYAHMGISPLVLLDREVKDLRNAIISVALPGEAPLTNITKVTPVNNLEVDNADDELVESEGAEEELQPNIEIDLKSNSSTSELDDSKADRDGSFLGSPAASRRRRRTTSVAD